LRFSQREVTNIPPSRDVGNVISVTAGRFCSAGQHLLKQIEMVSVLGCRALLVFAGFGQLSGDFLTQFLTRFHR